jgi:hypothetical protein
MTGQQQQDKPTTPPLGQARVDTKTGEVDSPLWLLRARFVGFQEPKGWSMEGRTGTSYKVDIRTDEGTVLMKVAETVYNNMKHDGLEFGDHIDLVFGRTVVAGELRVLPTGFRLVRKS